MSFGQLRELALGLLLDDLRWVARTFPKELAVRRRRRAPRPAPARLALHVLFGPAAAKLLCGLGRAATHHRHHLAVARC